MLYAVSFFIERKVVTSKELKQQIDLLVIRKQALKIALKLFETVKTEDAIHEVTMWFDQSNISTNPEIIYEAIAELKKLAVRYDLNLDE